MTLHIIKHDQKSTRFDNILLWLNSYSLPLTNNHNLAMHLKRCESRVEYIEDLPKTKTNYRGVSQPNIATISLILSD